MVTIIVGLVLIGFTVVCCLPAGLNWGEQILVVLKGGLPILSAFIGLLAIAIGYADIKDKQTAKKERENIRKNEKINTENAQNQEANG